MKRYKKGDRIETAELGAGTIVRDNHPARNMHIVMWDKTPAIEYNLGHNPCLWLPGTFEDISDKTQSPETKPNNPEWFRCNNSKWHVNFEGIYQNDWPYAVCGFNPQNYNGLGWSTVQPDAEDCCKKCLHKMDVDGPEVTR